MFGDDEILIRHSRVVNLAPGGNPGRSYGSGKVAHASALTTKKYSGSDVSDVGAQKAADRLRRLLVQALPETLRKWASVHEDADSSVGKDSPPSSSSGRHTSAQDNANNERRPHKFEDASLVSYDSPNVGS